ncbi:hypothetical protein HPB50_020215 [Hyalomma asiaticum]|uniref:Uncharacterized protein n=1 Tax=Hyalomma asiaticum TaxID=266040 RepID=A0ACB7T8T5_HYAAI|nr:hypothetical protein HPB50_020215 [Hyalomma asiaticum]
MNSPRMLEALSEETTEEILSLTTVRVFVLRIGIVCPVLSARASVEDRYMHGARNGANRRTYRAYVALLAEDINSDWDDIDAAINRMRVDDEVSCSGLSAYSSERPLDQCGGTRALHQPVSLGAVDNKRQLLGPRCSPREVDRKKASSGKIEAL